MARFRVLWPWLLITVLPIVSFFSNAVPIAYQGRKYVNEGDPFTITCLRTSFGVPKWTKDGSAIIPNEENNFTLTSERMDTTTVIMRLTVDSANWNHRGEYKCDPLDQTSHPIEVVLSRETETLLSETSMLLPVNETLTLYCPDSIVPKNVLKINWYKDGHHISEVEDSRFKFEGQSLFLQQPIEQDAGAYLCLVEVKALTFPMVENTGHVIQVTYAARVEEFPAQIRPILGRNFTLECKVHGYPVPRVTWFVDGMPAEWHESNNSRYSILDNNEGLPDAVFFIEKVTFDDIHVLTCMIDNMEGSMDTSVLLAVRENMIDTNEVTPGSGIQLIPGTDLVLQCNTTDDPNLHVIWYRNGLPVNTTDTRFNVDNSNNSLVVHHTTEADTGSYMCVANTRTSMVNATINVRTKVKLLSFDNSRNVVQGQNIVLECNVTQGMPLPTLEWLKDGITMNLSDPRIAVKDDDRGILNAKVTIKEADYEDRAEYMCIATNELGPMNATILIRVKDKYAALWPFIGICVEVAILCTIIFVYEKKRQKPEFDESENDNATENKAVSDQEDKSHEIRQRK